nr:MAG TPA: Vpu protein [Caudoviricetes sp.]
MCVIGSEIDFPGPIFVCMFVALICAMCAWIETYYFWREEIRK